MDLRRGKVVYAVNVTAPDGTSKDRRVIVLNPVSADVSQCVVTATLRRPEHDPLREVPIPHGKNFTAHPQTSFEQPTVAVCDWIVDIHHSDFRPDWASGCIKSPLLHEINQTITLLMDRANGSAEGAT